MVHYWHANMPSVVHVTCNRCKSGIFTFSTGRNRQLTKQAPCIRCLTLNGHRNSAAINPLYRLSLPHPPECSRIRRHQVSQTTHSVPSRWLIVNSSLSWLWDLDDRPKYSNFWHNVSMHKAVFGAEMIFWSTDTDYNGDSWWQNFQTPWLWGQNCPKLFDFYVGIYGTL